MEEVKKPDTVKITIEKDGDEPRTIEMVGEFVLVGHQLLMVEGEYYPVSFQRTGLHPARKFDVIGLLSKAIETIRAMPVQQRGNIAVPMPGGLRPNGFPRVQQP